MAVVSSFDMVVGDTEHLSVFDQSHAALPVADLTWSYDTGINSKFTVAPDQAGTGWVATAVAECNGTLTLTATRGSQTVSMDFPVVVSAALTGLIVETP